MSISLLISQNGSEMHRQIKKGPRVSAGPRQYALQCHMWRRGIAWSHRLVGIHLASGTQCKRNQPAETLTCLFQQRAAPFDDSVLSPRPALCQPLNVLNVQIDTSPIKLGSSILPSLNGFIGAL